MAAEDNAVAAVEEMDEVEVDVEITTTITAIIAVGIPLRNNNSSNQIHSNRKDHLQQMAMHHLLPSKTKKIKRTKEEVESKRAP